MNVNSLEPAPLNETIDGKSFFSVAWQRWFSRVESLWNKEAWIAPTLTNGWVNFSSTYIQAGYYQDGFGNVHIRGLIKDGTISTSCFTLPAGYRPQLITTFVQYGNTGAGQILAYIEILTTGAITIVGVGGAGQHISLNAVFKAYQ